MRVFMFALTFTATLSIGASFASAELILASDMTAPGGASASEFVTEGGLVGANYTLGTTTPGKWGTPPMGTPAGVVTWSLSPSIDYAADGGGVGVALSSFMPAGFKAEIIAAFAQWSAVADITFVEVADSGTAFNAAGATGDIRIGAHTFDGPGGSSAHAYFPPVQGTSAASDIHFDLADSWKIGFGGPGFDIQQVAAHEIGHAIGLGHSPVFGSLMNTIYTESFSGVQADDIAGAIAIYGAAQPAVPEPGSLVLFALGALGLGVVKIRRRRRSPTTETAA